MVRQTPPPTGSDTKAVLDYLVKASVADHNCREEQHAETTENFAQQRRRTRLSIWTMMGLVVAVISLVVTLLGIGARQVQRMDHVDAMVEQIPVLTKLGEARGTRLGRIEERLNHIDDVIGTTNKTVVGLNHYKPHHRAAP